MENYKTINALIPARGGSKRIKYKNMKYLGNRPLIYYTIIAAATSGLFQKIVVSTDDDTTARFAAAYRIDIHRRIATHATDTSPDVEWIKDYIETSDKQSDYFMILRPTSPFRTVETIHRAWAVWLQNDTADSLRAVSPVKQHPGKMWQTVNGNRMTPVMNYPEIDGHCSYNLPTQSLPEIYIQNGSLEIGQTRNVLTRNTVSGTKIVPFFTYDLEGFDINTQDDWVLAEKYMEGK